MKRAKRLYTLLGILAVVSVLTFCVLNYQEKQGKPSKRWEEIDNKVKGRTDTRSRQAQGHQASEADQISDIATDIVEVKETRG